MLGLLVAAIAGGVSLATYQAATEASGGPYVVLWGAVLWGGWKAITSFPVGNGRPVATPTDADQMTGNERELLEARWNCARLDIEAPGWRDDLAPKERQIFDSAFVPISTVSELEAVQAEILEVIESHGGSQR